MKPIRYLAYVAISSVLAGCASYAGIAPELSELQLRDAAALQPTPQTNATPVTAWPAPTWWRAFADPGLESLMIQALVDNLDVQAAAVRFKQAEAASGLAESTLWPQVNASATSTRERFSEFGTTPPPVAGTTASINDLQLTGQWTLDFFGRNRATLQAALGKVRAADAEQQATRVLLTTAVARRYYQLAGLLAQRAVLTQRQHQQTTLAQLRQRRFAAGIDTRLTLESASAGVPDSARALAQLDEQIVLLRHALAALLGQGPQALATLTPRWPQSPQSQSAQTLANWSLPTQLPADLLGHRADISAARWRVEAARQQLHAEQAAFYPNLDLRAFLGFSALGFDHWLAAGSRQPGVGVALSLPVFDAGRLRNQYRAAAADVDAAVVAYNSTLLNAVRQTADALSTLQLLEQQRSQQQAVLASTERRYALAQQRYRADLTDQLTLLDAENQVLTQQLNVVVLQARWLDARLALVEALGGSFAASPAAP